MDAVTVADGVLLGEPVSVAVGERVAKLGVDVAVTVMLKLDDA